MTRHLVNEIVPYRALIRISLGFSLIFFYSIHSFGQTQPRIENLDFNLRKDDKIEINYSLMGCNSVNDNFQLHMFLFQDGKRQEIRGGLIGDYPIVGCGTEKSIVYNILEDLGRSSFSGNLAFELTVLRRLQSLEAKVIYNSKGVFIRGNDENMTGSSRFIDEYFRTKIKHHGTYRLTIRENPPIRGAKILDQYSIHKLETEVYGPASVLNSLLLPGLGSLKVTNHEKGWKTLALFAAFTGTAVGMKVYSNHQYEKYLSATGRQEIDEFYEKANSAHQIAIVSGGLAASIYLHEIYAVIKRGMKNKKDSRYGLK